MSILRPINYAGAWEFRSPVPVPAGDIVAGTQVSISFNADWIPAVFSALKVLTRPEAYIGTLADIQRAVSDAHNLFDYRTGGSMSIGLVVEHCLSVLPSNWLACDGSTHLRVDWPDLYAIIDAAYIVDADHFKVPDFRGRSPLGSGTGTGLTARAVNAQGGEESHVLSVGELAAHTHPITAIQTTAGGPASVLGNTVTGIVHNLATGSTGSGNGHNTMHPFTAVKFAIVAGN